MSSKGQKWLAAGTATLIAEPVFALAHQGGVGVILGLAAGAAAYALMDDVEQVTGKRLSLPDRTSRDPRPEARGPRGKSRLAYRLLVGKSVREEERGELNTDELEDDTVVIPGLEEVADVAVLSLGEGLQPHPNVIFSHSTAILGQPGVGKSNLVSVLCEELGQYDAPLIVLDKKPEYDALCQQPYLAHPSKCDASNITPHNAQEIAVQMIERRLHVVLDLASYSPANAALVMIGLLAGITRYQAKRPFEQRVPCTVVLEEAHYWLPQDQALSALRGIKYGGEPLQSLLTRAWTHTASLSRDLGIGVISATQRPAAVDKRLIAYAQNRFLLHAVEARDLEVYREYGCSAAQVQQLGTGDAWVRLENEPPGVYHIRRRYSPDLSRSPGLENIATARAGESSPPSHSPIEGAGERGNAWEDGNAGMRRNEAGMAPQAAPTYREYPPMTGHERDYSQTSGKVDGSYTHEEETLVLRTALDLIRETGKVTRGAIQERLRWSNRKFTDVIKPVCDKHGIALRD